MKLIKYVIFLTYFNLIFCYEICNKYNKYNKSLYIKSYELNKCIIFSNLNNKNVIKCIHKTGNDNNYNINSEYNIKKSENINDIDIRYKEQILLSKCLIYSSNIKKYNNKNDCIKIYDNIDFKNFFKNCNFI